MEFLAGIGFYAAGLVNVVVFIAGFIVGHRVKRKLEAGGQPFVKTKEHDPVRNESVEALIDRAQADCEAWEK